MNRRDAHAGPSVKGCTAGSGLGCALPRVGAAPRAALAASRGLRPPVGARLRRVRSPSDVRTSTYLRNLRPHSAILFGPRSRPRLNHRSSHRPRPRFSTLYSELRNLSCPAPTYSCINLSTFPQAVGRFALLHGYLSALSTPHSVLRTLSSDSTFPPLHCLPSSSALASPFTPLKTT